MARRYGVEGQMYNWIRTRSWISVRHISLFLWSHCLWVLRAFLPIYVVRNIHDRIWRRRRDRYQHCHLYLLIWPVFRISRLVWEGCFYSNFQKLCWENLRMNIFNDCWFYNTTYSNNAKKGRGLASLPMRLKDNSLNDICNEGQTPETPKLQ